MREKNFERKKLRSVGQVRIAIKEKECYKIIKEYLQNVFERRCERYDDMVERGTRKPPSVSPLRIKKKSITPFPELLPLANTEAASARTILPFNRLIYAVS